MTKAPCFAAVAFHPLECAGDLRSTLLMLATLGSAQRGDWRWPGDQLGKPAEVLRNRCQRELELGTAWSLRHGSQILRAVGATIE
jgi:hypothetical protein